MADLKLFALHEAGTASELSGRGFELEKDLQRVIEANMETIFGVRLVKSEHSTGALHAGRIDSLGIDENNSPVIFEYKRSQKGNLINQGLFYFDWLVDHRGDFTELVRQRLGDDIAASVDWQAPRLVCIANDFDRYDEHAVRQIGRNIELVRYKQFDGKLLALEQVYKQSGPTAPASQNSAAATSQLELEVPQPAQTAADLLQDVPAEVRELYASLETEIESLGDDITKKILKHYFAFRRFKNFASVVVQNKQLLLILKVDPTTVELEEGFSRDVTHLGHLGVGDLELRIDSTDDIDRAKSLMRRSYEDN